MSATPLPAPIPDSSSAEDRPAPVEVRASEKPRRKTLQRPKLKEDIGTLQRRYERLLGLPEANILDKQPGAAVHLYTELAAPYQPIPPLLAMHFRDLARLQLELEAWEAIRDAEMEYRAQQTRLEIQRRRREMERSLDSFALEIYEKGIWRLPDSFAKLKEQTTYCVILADQIRKRDFSTVKMLLERLYGKDLHPDHERGRMICLGCRSLIDPEHHPPLTEDNFSVVLGWLEAEERDVIEARIAAEEQMELTLAAGRARLAPTREDHWMNRQGDRLRQAIDRKMRFTPVLLKALGLAYESRRAGPGRPRKRADRRTPGKASMSLKQQQFQRQRTAARGSRRRRQQLSSV
jgi:hypothetical protein